MTRRHLGVGLERLVARQQGVDGIGEFIPIIARRQELDLDPGRTFTAGEGSRYHEILVPPIVYVFIPGLVPDAHERAVHIDIGHLVRNPLVESPPENGARVRRLKAHRKLAEIPVRPPVIRDVHIVKVAVVRIGARTVPGLRVDGIGMGRFARRFVHIQIVGQDRPGHRLVVIIRQRPDIF